METNSEGIWLSALFSAGLRVFSSTVNRNLFLVCKSEQVPHSYDSCGHFSPRCSQPKSCLRNWLIWTRAGKRSQWCAEQKLPHGFIHSSYQCPRCIFCGGLLEMELQIFSVPLAPQIRKHSFIWVIFTAPFSDFSLILQHQGRNGFPLDWSCLTEYLLRG